jgi:hypothetical protein
MIERHVMSTITITQHSIHINIIDTYINAIYLSTFIITTITFKKTF